MDPGTLDFPLHRRPAESGPGCVLHVNHDSNYEHGEDKIKQDRLFDKVNDSVGVHGVSFMEVDGANRVAIQTRIEELLRIFHLGTFGECQPHRVLERICYAYYSIMRPNGNSRWFGWFFPLYFFDHGREGFLDQSAQL